MWKLARSISAKNKKKKAKADWETVMQEHREFVASVKRKKKAIKDLMFEFEKLEKSEGSYMIRCDELSGGWDNCASLNIEIAAVPKYGILEAAVEFGIFEGTMLLAFKEADLDDYVAVASVDDYDNPAPAFKKRKASTKSIAPKAGRGRLKKQVKISGNDEWDLYHKHK